MKQIDLKPIVATEEVAEKTLRRMRSLWWSAMGCNVVIQIVTGVTCWAIFGWPLGFAVHLLFAAFCWKWAHDSSILRRPKLFRSKTIMHRAVIEEKGILFQTIGDGGRSYDEMFPWRLVDEVTNEEDAVVVKMKVGGNRRIPNAAFVSEEQRRAVLSMAWTRGNPGLPPV